MSLRVAGIIEKSLPELNECKKKEILTLDEIRSIVAKRETFESKINSVAARKEDFLRYLYYEKTLDETRRRRKHELGIKKRLLCDTHYMKRAHFIYERSLRKFNNDVSLWLTYIRFCLKHKCQRVLARVFSRAVQLHPRHVGLWSLSALYEYEHGRGIRLARVIFQHALRANEGSQELFAAFYGMESHHALRPALMWVAAQDEALPAEVQSAPAVPGVLLASALDSARKAGLAPCAVLPRYIEQLRRLRGTLLQDLRGLHKKARLPLTPMTLARHEARLDRLLAPSFGACYERCLDVPAAADAPGADLDLAALRGAAAYQAVLLGAEGLLRGEWAPSGAGALTTEQRVDAALDLTQGGAEMANLAPALAATDLAWALSAWLASDDAADEIDAAPLQTLRARATGLAGLAGPPSAAPSSIQALRALRIAAECLAAEQQEPRAQELPPGMAAIPHACHRVPIGEWLGIHAEEARAPCLLDREAACALVARAAGAMPQCWALWHARIALCLSLSCDSDACHALLEQALHALPAGSASLPEAWRVALHLASRFAWGRKRVLALLLPIVRRADAHSAALRTATAEWSAAAYPAHKAHRVAQQLLMFPGAPLPLHVAALRIQEAALRLPTPATQAPGQPTVATARQLLERMVADFGSANAEVWMHYVRFERRFGAARDGLPRGVGVLPACNRLAQRAARALQTPFLRDVFAEQYAALVAE